MERLREFKAPVVIEDKEIASSPTIARFLSNPVFYIRENNRSLKTNVQKERDRETEREEREEREREREKRSQQARSLASKVWSF